jgi:threonine/homoserine/homoserine lactone efflux protein
MMRFIAFLLIVAGAVCSATLVFGNKIFGITLIAIAAVLLWLAWLQDKSENEDDNNY